MAKITKTNSETKFIFFDNLDKVGEITLYYGFEPHKSPDIKKVDMDNAKSLLEGDFIEENNSDKKSLPLHVEEKIALLRKYTEEELNTKSQPVLMYFKEPFRGSIKKGASVYNRYCDLEILGNSKSIAEAILIQTARAILKEEGYENICIEINSIGDRESINKFTRDLTSHYKKNISDMHAECRQLLKKDPFELLSCQNDKCKKINETAPKSMDFLSEQSRIHFQEVLEYLEALDIPYKINNSLIGNRKYCTETIFTIIDGNYDKKSKSQKVLAIGVRYDGLAKKIGFKKEIQGVGVSILIKSNRPDLRKEIKKIKKPFASFVQLGFESKLLSLGVIESLRSVKIPLLLSLAKDRLGAQVSMVEKKNIPYSIIMGKKEAMDKSAIVRNMDTHAQDIVPLNELPKYMKKLEK
jgi:histidyl-tRNA synthetase